MVASWVLVCVVEEERMCEMTSAKGASVWYLSGYMYK